MCVIECSSSQQMLPLPVLPLGLTYLLPIARLVILGVSFFQASGIQKHCYHFPCLPDTQSNGVTISSSPSSPKALVSPPVPVRHVSVCVLSFFLLIGFSPVIHLKKKKKRPTLPPFLNFRRSAHLTQALGFIFAAAGTAHHQGPMK